MAKKSVIKVSESILKFLIVSVFFLGPKADGEYYILYYTDGNQCFIIDFFPE